MKFLILGLIFGSISYMGFKIGDSYKSKQNFYSEFINFLLYLKSQINFLKTDILQVIENYKTKDKNLNKLLLELKSAIKNQDIEKLNLDFLHNDEKQEFNNLFNCLGKSDLYNELEFLDKNIEIFNQLLEQKKSLNIKYGVMYKKLGILFAFFICIVLI